MVSINYVNCDNFVFFFVAEERGLYGRQTNYTALTRLLLVRVGPL